MTGQISDACCELAHDRSCSVDLHEGAANGQRRAGFDVERTACIQCDSGSLDREPAVRLDVEGATLAFDREAVAGSVVEANAVVVDGELLAILQLELDESLPSVVEQQLVA